MRGLLWLFKDSGPILLLPSLPKGRKARQVQNGHRGFELRVEGEGLQPLFHLMI